MALIALQCLLIDQVCNLHQRRSAVEDSSMDFLVTFLMFFWCFYGLFGIIFTLTQLQHWSVICHLYKKNTIATLQQLMNGVALSVDKAIATNVCCTFCGCKIARVDSQSKRRLER